MDGMNKEKWNAMTKEQKREHIWEYYKMPIIAVIAVIAVAAWFIYERVTYVDPMVEVILTDVAERQDPDGIFQEFLAEYEYEAYPGAVALQQNMVFDFDDAAYTEINGRHVETLMAMLSMGQQDILITNAKVFGMCAVDSAMLDLSTVLPEELLEKHKDRLLYTDDGGEAESYPCGIQIDGNPWIEGIRKYYQGYAGIPERTDDQKLAVDFMIYLLNQFDTLEAS